MAWCRQATSHYLGQCWPRPRVTRPQSVKASQTVSLRSDLNFTQKSICWGTDFQKWACFVSEFTLKVSSFWKWAQFLVRQFLSQNFSSCYSACWLMLSFLANHSSNWFSEVILTLTWNDSTDFKSELANSRWQETRKVSLLSMWTHILVKWFPVMRSSDIDG